MVLDLRALQDPNYARRGIGRHTLALLQNAPENVRMVGLIDPDLPDPIAEAAELVSETHQNAYAALHALGSKSRHAPYVALSPMTHDPLFGARFLADQHRLRMAVVYDFIPRRWPERYLPGPAEKLSYATQLRWLTRCDLFAPISQSAGDDLRELLSVSRRSVAVTGAPLDPLFESARFLGQTKRRHLLVVGGGDPRKNPDVVVQAHAASRILQNARIPLIIAGQYPPQALDHFRAIAARNGGQTDLVQVPGGVSENELVTFYSEAIAVVCPSYDEGFDLPIVEGMAAGIPVIASDIPVHRELIPDAELRFAPADAAMLVPLLERALTDITWCSEIVERQASIWPRFRAVEVGRRFWDHLVMHWNVAAPAVARSARPRVAMLTPLTPDVSGVADYSTATCVELQELVDLTVFTETVGPTPVAGTKVKPFSALPALVDNFDAVVNVIGNSHFHLKTFEALTRYGGAAIAHDARLLSFYRICLGRDRAISAASREAGRPVDETEIHRWMHDEHLAEALFLDETFAAASPMIVHSQITANLLASRFGRSPVHIPFSIYRAWSPAELTPIARSQARHRAGIAPDEIALVTLGAVHETKAPEECVWALDMLRSWGIPARLHLVGMATPPAYAAYFRAMVESLGLGDHVRLADAFVPDAVYRDALLGADVAIQLRTYANGGLSGALLDCAAAGVPTVCNQSLADAVGTPDAYVRAIPDELSSVLLANAVADLLEDQRSDGAAEHREAARLAFSIERSMASYAVALCHAVGVEPARQSRGSVA